MDDQTKPTAAVFDAILETFPDLLFLVSPEGTIVDYRGGRHAALYAPPDAFLRRSIHEVLPPPVAATLTEAIARVCATEQPVAVDYALSMPDGEHIFEARLVPLVPDVILAICRDVTESLRTNQRLQTERKLEEARRTEMLSLLRSTLDSTGDGVLVVDRCGVMATFNRQFVEMWQVPKAIVESRNDDRALAFVLDQLVDPDAFLAKVRELYASPDAESFDVLTFKDGRTFERYSQPQYVDGDSVGRVWSFRDVTVRVRAEAALRESEQRFRQAAEAESARRQSEARLLQAQKLEAMGTLAGGIAHNFNNALAVIVGNTEIVRRLSSTDPTVRESLDAVLIACERAQAMVRRMQTFAEPHAGERRPVQLGPIVAEATARLRAALPATVQVALGIDPDAPTVLADPSEIEQLVVSLVSNASQAVTAPAIIEVAVGGLDVSTERVRIEPDLRAGRYATISVADCGAGMDEATMRRVFDPFFTTKAPGEGAGLGLSVVHGIVTRHGGAIRVWSELGIGSRFEVYLPATAVEATAPESSLDKWRVLLATRSNVLLEGPEAVTEPVLRGLIGHSAEPVGYWGDALGDQRPRTLVVRDVGALAAADQHRLLRWLETGDRSQILSTTAKPLFAFVERGQFRADLFYRLNVLRVDLQKGTLEDP